MSLEQDVKAIKFRLNNIVYKNKLGKKITNDILFPILDELKDREKQLLEELGDALVRYLIDRIANAQLSGWSYTIVEYDPDAPRGQKEKEIGTYTSSVKGGPPTGIPQEGVPTGSLIDSIKFEISSNNTLLIGQLIKETGYEFESSFFRGGTIFVIPGHAHGKSVSEYGNILDDPKYMHKRIWFNNVLMELKPKIREIIRGTMKEVLRQSTRRTSVRKAITFRIYMNEA